MSNYIKLRKTFEDWKKIYVPPVLKTKGKKSKKHKKKKPKIPKVALKSINVFQLKDTGEENTDALRPYKRSFRLLQLLGIKKNM